MGSLTLANCERSSRPTARWARSNADVPGCQAGVVTKPVLSLTGVSVRYGNVTALDSVDLQLAGGSITAVTGPNGAGKSTLLRVAANACRPTAGTRVGPNRCVFLPGDLDPPRLAARKWLDVPIDRHLSPLEVLDDLRFVGNLDAPANRLSLGNWRKLLLAHALSARADLVVLDELFLAIDERSEPAIGHHLDNQRRRGSAVLASVHRPNRLAFDRVVALANHGADGRTPKAAPHRSISFRGSDAQLAKLRRAAIELGVEEVTEHTRPHDA